MKRTETQTADHRAESRNPFFAKAAEPVADKPADAPLLPHSRVKTEGAEVYGGNVTVGDTEQPATDESIREDVRTLVVGSAKASFPTKNSADQDRFRKLVEGMREGKDGLPYVVEARSDGRSVLVSLSAPGARA